MMVMVMVMMMSTYGGKKVSSPIQTGVKTAARFLGASIEPID
jgi:hypothetical protein